MARANIDTSKEVWPVCYAYTTPDVPKHNGWTKIGFTERDAETRVAEQVKTADIDAEIAWIKNAIYEGSSETFHDTDFHRYLVNLGIEKKPKKEWFKIDPKSAKYMFDDFRDTRGFIKADDKPAPYQLRAEQAEAVAMTIDYFRSHDKGEFLWNAKPRFGKTLSSYDLCMKMGFENILIVTNRPAIANSWYDDYKKFIGTGSGYIFVSRVEGIKDEKYVYDRKDYVDILPSVDNYKGLIEFVSLQDLKGSVHFGGDKPKLSHIKDINWDILIIDEAHEGVDTYKTDTAFNQIKRKNTLHLSGTPFKALASDKFPDEAIYNWTYADEQRAKAEWEGPGENPYSVLPRLNLFTYQMSDVIRDEIREGISLDEGDFDYAFDLNEFFSTDGRGAFIYNKEVDDFLDALTDPNRTQFPFSTPELRDEIKHSFWILNRVASAEALQRKLEVNPVFRDYKVVLAAGDGKADGDESELVSEESLTRVREAIKSYDKTITLSVGQLTTGVTVPEWTAVLMLANMKSPSLYMQAAFRSQNPCLFSNAGKHFRKKNAYVFDFDPARTLDIFDKFANDLSPHTSGGYGNSGTRKKNIRELLNFFPVYSEDEDGSMVLLDAEKVLSIPRKIKSAEVVNHGFMSNFLFQNISNIFRAPAAVREILEKFDRVKEPKNKKPIDIDDETADDLDLNEKGEVDIPDKKIIGLADGIFGDKVYGEIREEIDDVSDDLMAEEKTQKAGLDELVDTYSEPISSLIVENVKKTYEDDIRRPIENNIRTNIKDKVEPIVKKRHGDYEVEKNELEAKKKKDIENSKSSAQISSIEEKYQKEIEEKYKELTKHIKEDIEDYGLIEDSAKSSIKIIETDKKEKEKRTIEDDVRDRLRGFSRTIPSFLMAYGNYDTSLANFDRIIPEDVFLEVTSITVEEFRGLRDGFGYTDPDTGEEKFFEGNLFDELVFDDSVKEFLDKKEELKNYFDEENKKDIFDYIPPQKTNQVFTPKRVVKKMVDLLEKENPGCFDDPTNTFLDPYMKSGLFIAEIVKRLYNSKALMEKFPDRKDRLNHIFKNQVYGIAPTEIIYKIATNFILGFSDEIEIGDHKLRLLDSLESIQKDKFEKNLERLYPELRDE